MTIVQDAQPFKPIRTRRTFQEAVEQIATAIHQNAVRVGDRLPSERDLATAMQISRPTIREALQALAAAGVIDIVNSGRGGGAYVRTDIIPASLYEDQTPLRVSEVAEVLVTRRILEPRIAQLAAMHATSADFERLQRTIGQQEASTGDRARFLSFDMRFHHQIAQAAHNATVEALMRVFIRRLELAQDLALREHDRVKDEATWTIAVADHDRILRAIAGRDPAASEAAMTRHLAILEDAWTEASGWAFHRNLPDFLLRAPGVGLQGDASSSNGRQPPIEP